MSVFARFIALFAVFLSFFCVAPSASAVEVNATHTFSVDQKHWLWHEWNSHGQPKATWPTYWRDSCRLTRVPCTKEYWENLPRGFVVTVPSYVSQEIAEEYVNKDVRIATEPRVNTSSATNVVPVTQQATFVTEVKTLMSAHHTDVMDQFVVMESKVEHLQQSLQLAFLVLVCSIILLFFRDDRKLTQRSDEDDDAFLSGRDDSIFDEPKQCAGDAVKTMEESKSRSSCGAPVATRSVQIFLEKGSFGNGLELGGKEKKCHEFLKPLEERPILQPGIYYADVTDDDRIVTILSAGPRDRAQP